MSDHEDETITEENAPSKVVPQITAVTNISTKFPYLKKGDAKSMTTDKDGNLKIRPPVTAEEHQQAIFGGNAESKKMQKSLLKQKFKEFKISKEEGLDKGYDKMQKILTQKNTLKIKPEPEDVNMKFLRGLPPSWSGIALILKTKGGLKYISFDDLYNKLKFLEINTKGYSSSSSTLSNAAFGSSKSKCSVVDDVIYSFFANHEIDQHLVYEDLDQMNKEEFEKYDLKHQMAMLSIKVHIFEKKHRRKIKFNGRENASIDWDKQTEEGNTEPRSLENFGMVAGIEIASDADSEGEAAHEKQELMTKLDNEIANQAKWNNSGKNLYKLIDNFMSVRTKRGLGLNKYIGEGKLGIDDSKFSIFHTNSDELEGQPIYNRFASVDHIKAVPPPLTGNYMPSSNIPDIDESQMVYGKKATDSSEIKTNDDNCDLHEQRFAKNAEGKGILGRRPTRKPVNPNRPIPVSAGQPNPVSTGEATLACNSIPLSISTGDGILGPRPLNIQPKSTY
nr:hypothetical protein [Tanacetum cinerariifolium]